MTNTVKYIQVKTPNIYRNGHNQDIDDNTETEGRVQLREVHFICVCLCRLRFFSDTSRVMVLIQNLRQYF